MALYYPPLDADRTYKVWEMQIRRLYERFPDLVCNRQGILDYGTRLFSIQTQKKPGTCWNGRQIRNAFQSAMALARNRSTKAHGATIELLVQDFEQITTAVNEFDDYLFRTRGRYEVDRARFNQLRAGEKQQHQQPSSTGYNNMYYTTTSEYRPRATMAGELFEDPSRTQSSNYLSPHNMTSQRPPSITIYSNPSIGNSRPQDYQQAYQQSLTQQPFPGLPQNPVQAQEHSKSQFQPDFRQDLSSRINH
jgi:hypothetical protein